MFLNSQERRPQPMNEAVTRPLVKDKVIAVRVDAATRAQLEAIAQRDDRTLSGTARQLIGHCFPFRRPSEPLTSSQFEPDPGIGVSFRRRAGKPRASVQRFSLRRGS